MKNIIKSPLISRLGDKLIDSILCRKNEFDTITVVFPSSKTEQWFKTYWLKNRSEILMNVKFLNIDEALLSLILTKEEYKLIKRQDLKSLIIKHLASKNNDIDYPLDIKDYLYNKEGEVDSIRVYDLANELSKLFFNYEEDQVVIVGWEKQIYDHVLENAIEHGFATLDYVYKNKIDFKKNSI